MLGLFYVCDFPKQGYYLLGTPNVKVDLLITSYLHNHDTRGLIASFKVIHVNAGLLRTVHFLHRYSNLCCKLRQLPLLLAFFPAFRLAKMY